MCGSSKTALSSMPVELRGYYGQFSPVLLIGVDSHNKVGFVKYDHDIPAFVAQFSELRLSPKAYEPLFPESEIGANNDKENEIVKTFIPNEPVEVWLSWKKTNGLAHEEEDDTNRPNNVPVGSWWPGRVAAPILSAFDEPNSNFHQNPNGRLPPKALVVEMQDVRLPWTGVKNHPKINEEGSKEKKFVSLESSEALHHHTILLPFNLAKLATLPDVHMNLLKFCNAPCLIQCKDEAFAEDGQVGGGASGKAMIRLHLTSASQEAIRRAGLLELVHVMLLHERLQLLNLTSRQASGNMNGSQHTTNGLDNVYPAENGFDIQGTTQGSNSRSGSCVGAPSPALNSEIVSSMATDNLNSTSSVPPLHCIRINGGQNNAPMYRASFHVDRNLVGLVIGQNGSNISKAYEIPGVVNVTIDEATVTIIAKTQEACQVARDILDIVEIELPIEESFYPRILGTKGENLHNLVLHSGVKKAYLMGSLGRTRRMKDKRANISASQNKRGEEIDDGTQSISSEDALPVDEQLSPAVIIVGTRSSVNKMKLLLEYQFESWNELGELEGARKTLQSELRKIDGRQFSTINAGNSMRRRPPAQNGTYQNRGSAPPYGERTDSANMNGDSTEKRQFESGSYRRRMPPNPRKPPSQTTEQQPQPPPQNGISGDQFPPLELTNMSANLNSGVKAKGKNAKRKTSGGNRGGSNTRANGVHN